MTEVQGWFMISAVWAVAARLAESGSADQIMGIVAGACFAIIGIFSAGRG